MAVVFPGLRGVRIPFEDPGTLAHHNIPIDDAPGVTHEHPNGAAIRALAYYDGIDISVGSFTIVVGDRARRGHCLNIPNPRERRYGRFPIHSLAPLIEPRDVFRNAQAARVAQVGTQCQCPMTSAGPCVHTYTAIEDKYPGLAGLVRVRIFSYDVYTLTPAMIASYMLALRNTLRCEVDFRICVQDYSKLEGIKFHNELDYQYVAVDDEVFIKAQVAGNGSTHYGPHPSMQWLFRDPSPGCNLFWVVHRQYYPHGNCDDGVTMFQMAVSTNGDFQETPANDLPEIPEWDRAVQRVADTVGFAKEPSKCLGVARAVANKIISGKDTTVSLVVPSRLVKLVLQRLVVQGCERAATDADFAFAHALPHLHAAQTLNQAADEFQSQRSWHTMATLLVSIFAALLFGYFFLYECVGHGICRYRVNLFSWAAIVACVILWARLRGRYYAHLKLSSLKEVLLYVAVIALCVNGAVGRVPVTQGVISNDDVDRGFDVYHTRGRRVEPEEPDAVMSYDLEPCRDGTLPELWGICPAAWRPVFTANCQCNEVTSLNERALAARPSSTSEFWDAAVELGAVTRRLVALKYSDYTGAAYDAVFKTKMSIEAWLTRDHISASKREQLREAYDEFKKFGLGAADYLRNVFVKIEPVSKIIAGFFTDYAPRTIMGMKDKLQVALGPFFAHLSKVHTAMFSKHSPILYGIGQTSEEIGAWATFWMGKLKTTDSNVVLVEADASRFDKNLHRLVFEARLGYYTSQGAPKSVREAYAAKIKKKGFTRHGVYFQIDGTRASGDSDTSYDNTMINFDYWITILAKLAYMPGTDYALGCAGDDMILILASHTRDDGSAFLLGDLIEHYAGGSGMLWKVKFDVPLYDWTFLSALFLPDMDGTLVLVPKPGRIISRSGWSKRPLADPAAHARAVALGLYRTAFSMPILSRWVMRVLQLTEGIEAEPLIGRFQVRSTQQHYFASEAYASLALRYGISLADIQQIEVELLSIPSLPFVVDSGLIDLVIEKDLS